MSAKSSAPVGGKIQTPVKVPGVIDLSMVASAATAPVAATGAAGRGNGIRYRHVAQCDHVGSAKNGHYTAAVSVRAKNGDTARYYKCNDSTVSALKIPVQPGLLKSKISGSKMQSCAGVPTELSGSSAYVLFYERV